MQPNRRDFLNRAAAGLVTAPAIASLAAPACRSPGKLRILILGGTGFIGPHLVRACQANGHEVTLFNRGRTNTHLFPEVEKLIGDRKDNLTALEGKRWDAVIDNSAVRSPAWVRASAGLLKDAAATYLLTSTRSVYRSFPEVGMTEDAPLHEVDPAWVTERARIPYGPAKVLCERELEAAFGERSTIVRPGLIVGPGDATDRFTYWPARIDQGGEVLAPGDPDNKAMFIDVRDLAEFYVHLVEQGTHGIFNALGPAAPLSFAELLYGIRAVTSASVQFTWVDTDFLIEREVQPYSDFPLWRPARDDYAGFQRFDLSRPLQAGLRYRPLAVTAADTLEFHRSRPKQRQNALRSGVSRDREAGLLAAWKATKK